jgi:outer membrane protein W
MNKSLLLVAVLGILPGQLYAQSNSSLDSDIDAEIEAVTAGRTAPQAASGSPAGAAIAPRGVVNGGQPIYILNQATPTSNAQVQQSQVQAQPQVDILAAPISKSRAEQIREARQQAEVETENKIVEKLEASRMEDEKRRASVLFSEPFNQLSQQNNISAQNVNVNQPQTVQQQVVPVQPVYVPAPAPVQVIDETSNRDLIRDEIRAALSEETKQEVDPIETRYFGAVIGVGNYPEVGNVSDVYSLGATYGTQFDSAYAVEGTFLYSDYKVAQAIGGAFYPEYGYFIPRTVNVQQYSGALAVKYFLMDGMIKPTIGALTQYSYRTFAWSEDQSYFGYATPASSSTSSHAVDVGLTAGADILVNRKWSIGADFKYTWNLTSRISGSNFINSSAFGTPIEKLQNWNMGITLKATF